MSDTAEKLRTDLRALLALPDATALNTNTDGQVFNYSGSDNLDQKHLDVDLDGIPGIFIPPQGPGPFPAILYCHAHGGEYGLGRRELTDGARWLSAPPAADLIAAGFAVLCIDMPGFGERQSLGTESAIAKAMLWQGQPLFGNMLADLMKALDWLCAHPLVDANHIATFGVSMGAAHAYWLAALDDRVAAVAQLCMLADITPLIKCGVHDKHGHFLTVPGLLKIADSGDVAALVAPRPQFIGFGELDQLTPTDARASALVKVRAGYAQNSLQNNLEIFIEPESGHKETPNMRKAALNFLSQACA